MLGGGGGGGGERSGMLRGGRRYGRFVLICYKPERVSEFLQGITVSHLPTSRLLIIQGCNVT